MGRYTPTIGDTVCLSGLTNADFNHKQGVVARGLNDAGRYGIRIFGKSDIVGIKPKNIKQAYTGAVLRGPCATPPERTYGYNPHFFMSSDCDAGGTPSKYAEWEAVKDKPLGELFMHNHVNIGTVLINLSHERGLKLLTNSDIAGDCLAGKPVDPTDRGKLVDVDVDFYTALPATFEQSLYAGFQLLWTNGPKDLDEPTRQITFYLNDETTNIAVRFEFNNTPIVLSLIEQGNTCYISLTLASYN